MVKGKVIEMHTSHGPIAYNYFISTPNEQLADKVDPSLPTLLCLHGVYLPSYMFHYQFAEPALRRFNMVAVDLLSHGETEGAIPVGYTQVDQAHEIAAFMDAVELPACYIVGLSAGTILALQLALLHPKKVSGLFLISPLGTEEPEGVKQGRYQICENWFASFDDNGIADEEAMLFAISGGVELAFYGYQTSNIVNTLGQLSFPEALVHWGADQQDAYETATVKLCTERKNYDSETLRRLVNTPIALVYGTLDIAFPPEYMALFAQQLSTAGVAHTTHEIAGAPHYASITHPQIVNTLLAHFVANNWRDAELPATRNRIKFTTPFEEDMLKVGWKDLREEYSDDDDYVNENVEFDELVRAAARGEVV